MTSNQAKLPSWTFEEIEFSQLKSLFVENKDVLLNADNQSEGKKNRKFNFFGKKSKKLNENDNNILDIGKNSIDKK